MATSMDLHVLVTVLQTYFGMQRGHARIDLVGGGSRGIVTMEKEPSSENICGPRTSPLAIDAGPRCGVDGSASTGTSSGCTDLHLPLPHLHHHYTTEYEVYHWAKLLWTADAKVLKGSGRLRS